MGSILSRNEPSDKPGTIQSLVELIICCGSLSTRECGQRFHNEHAAGDDRLKRLGDPSRAMPDVPGAKDDKCLLVLLKDMLSKNRYGNLIAVTCVVGWGVFVSSARAIDDASARHVSGSCAMVVSVPITRTGTFLKSLDTWAQRA